MCSVWLQVFGEEPQHLQQHLVARRWPALSTGTGVPFTISQIKGKCSGSIDLSQTSCKQRVYAPLHACDTEDAVRPQHAEQPWISVLHVHLSWKTEHHKQ